MKTPLLIGILSASAAVLLAANFYRGHGPSSPAAPVDSVAVAPSPVPTNVQAKAAEAGTETGMTAATPKANTNAPAIPPRKRTTPAPAVGAAFDWATVESTDYKQYAQNLRAIGFPDELVKSIVALDLNAFYAPLEAEYKNAVAAPDAPMQQRQHLPTPEDAERLRHLRDIETQKQAALEEILGVYVPRETLRTPISRNYIAYDYALDQLPSEKRDAAQLALETEWFSDDAIKGLGRAPYVQQYRVLRETRDTALQEFLTPEEFNDFIMNTHPAGTELARRTVGMEPTDEEFAGMFEIALKNWVDTGGVGGLWRANHVSPEQIAVADAEMNAALDQALGPDRYLDYQMAVSSTGQKLRNFAERYGLSRETLGEAFQLQSTADQLNRSLQQVQTGRIPPGAPPVDPSQLEDRIHKLNDQTMQVLGIPLWEAWQEGKDLKVTLDP